MKDRAAGDRAVGDRAVDGQAASGHAIGQPADVSGQDDHPNHASAKKAKRGEPSPQLGGKRGPMAGLASFVTPPTPAVPIDSLDIQLLRMLNRDSRLSQRALSREVSLSAPAIGERVARLERLGVIRGYTLDIDWAALGYPMTVHIPITAAPAADFGQIVADLRKMPELADVRIVTGQWDLIARFRLRDQGHLQEVLLGQIWQIDGVQRVETFLELAGFDGEGLLGSNEDTDEDTGVSR